WRVIVHVLGAGDHARPALESAVRRERHPEAFEIVGDGRGDGLGRRAGHAALLIFGQGACRYMARLLPPRQSLPWTLDDNGEAPEAESAAAARPVRPRTGRDRGHATHDRHYSRGLRALRLRTGGDA